MSKPDPKLALLQQLDPVFSRDGFKLIKARSAFERDRKEVTDLYKLDFLSSTKGQRIQPGIVMRFASLDNVYHQVSGAKPADRKYHAAISFAIWRIYGGMEKYEFLLTSDDAVPSVVVKLVEVYRQIALPFFESHSTVADVDRLFNKAPNEYNTILYNADAWTRSAYATIAARLAGNRDYERLVRTYEEVMKTSNGGQKHGQYLALLKLLENETAKTR